LAEYGRKQREFEALGVRIAALSVDAAERAEAVRRQLGLAFPILCDPTREWVRAWSLCDEDEKGGIARSATFVLAPDRTVEFATIDSMARRVLAPDLLEWLQRGVAPERHGVIPGLGAWATVTMNMIRRGIVQK
jgi:peroxiredoxin